MKSKPIAASCSRCFKMLSTLLLLFATIPLLAAKHRQLHNMLRSKVNDNIFTVQIHYENQFVCLASVLSARIIITAAHCLPIAPALWAHYVIAAPNHMYSKSKNMIYDQRVLPEYKKRVYRGDIAVAQIGLPLRSPTAKLCTHPLRTGDKVTFLEYERNEKTYESHALLTNQLSVVSLDECSKIHETKLSSNNICAGNKNYNDFYDSGGPLIHNGELCGIQAWTNGKGTAPVVFMSIHNSMKFIKKAMSELAN